VVNFGNWGKLGDIWAAWGPPGDREPYIVATQQSTYVNTVGEEGHETCKTQLSHYPHHLIRAGMCQKIILSILSFAHALQTPNGWTGNTFGFSSASIPSETDPLRGEFYASSTFVHFLPKGYSRWEYTIASRDLLLSTICIRIYISLFQSKIRW
jgi:hypothetical protein